MGTWKEGKLLEGKIMRLAKSVLIMNLRDEVVMKFNNFENYYTILSEEGEQLDDGWQQETLELIEDNLDGLFFKEEAFDWGSSYKLLKEYGGTYVEEDS